MSLVAVLETVTEKLVNPISSVLRPRPKRPMKRFRNGHVTVP
jgi:hypothetical protein